MLANTFNLTGVVPAFGPWKEATRIAIKLPASVTYSQGAILGETIGTNEVQTVTLTSTTSSGTFTITYAGQTTAAISYAASAATVQAALEALSNVGTNNVSVTGSAGAWTLEFRNTLGKQNIAAVTCDSTSLVGTNEVQRVTITGTPTGGDFTLTYAGQTTAAIAFDATAGAVDSALEALSNIGAGDVTCTGGPLPGSFVVVTFTSALAATDVAAMTANGAGLTGGTAPAVAITTTTAGGPGTATPATSTAGAAGTAGTYKAFLSSNTDGSEVAKVVLEYAAATDASGNITLGNTSLGGDKQQFALGNTVSAFTSGTFRCEDLQQTVGAGQLTETAIGQLGKLIRGSATEGLLRIG